MFAELQEPSFYQIVQFFQGTNAGSVLFCETRRTVTVMEVPGPYVSEKNRVSFWALRFRE